jgi:hypothetical protein
MYVHSWVKLLTLAQQRIRNMRKEYMDDEIKMFERSAGLVLKIKDVIQELEDCSVSEELLDVLLKLQAETVHSQLLDSLGCC